MNLAALLKLTKGNVGPERLAELLKLAGLDAKFEPVTYPGRAAAFQRASKVAAQPSADVFVISGADNGGAIIEALIVFSKKPLDNAAAPQ